MPPNGSYILWAPSRCLDTLDSLLPGPRGKKRSHQHGKLTLIPGWGRAALTNGSQPHCNCEWTSAATPDQEGNCQTLTAFRNEGLGYTIMYTTPLTGKVIAQEEGILKQIMEEEENGEQWWPPDRLQRLGLSILLANLPIQNSNYWRYLKFSWGRESRGDNGGDFLESVGWSKCGPWRPWERKEQSSRRAPAAVFWHLLPHFNGSHTPHRLLLPMRESSRDSEAGLFLREGQTQTLTGWKLPTFSLSSFCSHCVTSWQHNNLIL